MIERLKKAIDEGRARDKAPFTDPAAAPLGADDEAAGIRHDPAAVAMALKMEADAPAGAQGAPGLTDERARDPHASSARPGFPRGAVAVLAVVIGMFVIAALLGAAMSCSMQPAILGLCD